MLIFVTGVGGQLGYDVMNELDKRALGVLVVIFRKLMKISMSIIS